MAAPVLDSRGAPLVALLEPSWGILGALGGLLKGHQKIPGGSQERPKEGPPAVKMAALVLDSMGAPLGALLEPSWCLLG
eukprot:5110607-Pyramimonas_sp.AAC.1